MLQVVKLRLYPNSQQQQALSQSFGNCRWLWNYFLDLINKTYADTGKGLSGYDIKKQIPQLKKKHEWLKLTYSQCLQQVCLNLGIAFNNFFEKRARYPRFKSKHGKQSIHYPQNVKILEGCLKLPMVGEVRAIFHREIGGKVKTVTVSKNKAGQYFAAILFEDGQDLPQVSTEGKTIGIDLGLNHFVITSDGSKFDNPRWINKHERNLKIKQQRLSRKQKGSNNRNKARKIVARVHNKIANCRSDFHHKLSRRIVNENQVICVENMNVKGMVKNHNPPAFGIPPIRGDVRGVQVGWGQFCTMLKYKAEREGKVYQEVERFFPSSKTCNICLNQVAVRPRADGRRKGTRTKTDSLPLEIRYWDCSCCGTKHIDRDINAAKNIRDEGLRILKTAECSCRQALELNSKEPATSGTGDQAYRQTVRRNRGGRKKSTIPLVSG